MPARWAAMTFSLTPPMGRTSPRRVISPVMARSGRTVLPVKRETSAVYMATPAEGPSLGTAPAGTWTWTSILEKESGSMPSLFGVVLEQGEGGLDGFLHHFADLAGELEGAFAGHLCGFDEEDFAADGSVGEAGDDAGGSGALGEFAFEAGWAEVVWRGRRGGW